MQPHPHHRPSHAPRVALLVAVVLCGLSAGFFHAYESSVTPGLAGVDDTTYVLTFQSINEAIRNPGFGIVFFGSVPAIAMAVAVNWRATRGVPRALIAAALPLYLSGMLITVAGNVGLNNDLAEVTPVTPAAATEARDDFEDDWNRLNLLRALAFGASFAALAAASLSLGADPTTTTDPDHARRVPAMDKTASS